MAGSSFGVELIQLNAEGLSSIMDDDEAMPSEEQSPAADDQTAVQTEDQQQSTVEGDAPAEEAPA